MSWISNEILILFSFLLFMGIFAGVVAARGVGASLRGSFAALRFFLMGILAGVVMAVVQHGVHLSLLSPSCLETVKSKEACRVSIGWHTPD